MQVSGWNTREQQGEDGEEAQGDESLPLYVCLSAVCVHPSLTDLAAVPSAAFVCSQIPSAIQGREA